MRSTERWLFSFRFDRRGQTSLWELKASQHLNAGEITDYPGEDIRVEFGTRKRVWIEICRDLDLDADKEAEITRAEDRARRFLREQFPKTDLLPTSSCCSSGNTSLSTIDSLIPA